MYHVSQISRPLTAVTVRFLKISDSAMSIVAGCAGIPKRTTWPPWRTIAERVLDRPERAGHLEHDAHPHALVLLGEPRADVLDLVEVHDGVRAQALRELDAGTGRGPRRAAAPRRRRARSRSRRARPARSRGSRPRAPRDPASTSRRRRSRTAPGGTRSPAAASSRSFVQTTDAGIDDVVGEAAVPVDAEDPRPLAHVRLPGPAVEADAARDVALGGDVRALLDARARSSRPRRPCRRARARASAAA